MLLPQLLQSPIFGLESLDSPQVAHAREELRRLQGIGNQTEAARAAEDSQRQQNIRDLRRELADVPNWREVPPYLQRTNAVLERVARELAGPDVADPIAALSTDQPPPRRRRRK